MIRISRRRVKRQRVQRMDGKGPCRPTSGGGKERTEKRNGTF
nr:MAG TPA: hypothetical protein [Caudoviricetes sp.]